MTFSVDPAILKTEATSYNHSITLVSAEQRASYNILHEVSNALKKGMTQHKNTIEKLQALEIQVKEAIEGVAAQLERIAGDMSKLQAQADSIREKANGDIMSMAMMGLDDVNKDIAERARSFSGCLQTETQYISLLGQIATEINKTSTQLFCIGSAKAAFSKFNHAETELTSVVFRGGILSSKLNAFAVAIEESDGAGAGRLEREFMAHLPDRNYWDTEEGKKFNSFFHDPASAGLRADGAAVQQALEGDAFNSAHPNFNSDIESAQESQDSALNNALDGYKHKVGIGENPWDKIMEKANAEDAAAKKNLRKWERILHDAENFEKADIAAGVVVASIIAAPVIAGAGGAGSGIVVAGGSEAAVVTTESAVTAGAIGAGEATAGSGVAGAIGAGEATVGAGAGGAATAIGTAEEIAAAEKAALAAQEEVKALSEAYRVAKASGNADTIAEARQALIGAKSKFDELWSIFEKLRSGF